MFNPLPIILSVPLDFLGGLQILIAEFHLATSSSEARPCSLAVGDKVIGIRPRSAAKAHGVSVLVQTEREKIPADKSGSISPLYLYFAEGESFQRVIWLYAARS
ncbi:hypothetical protein CIRG_01407 [Coccidioides immitis RMSCC 2394]|uniref:Uncharacterized protein n=1 Tax=Coccidioides immitis RMSCC 2394 TaxID=404692 RepID=A0A0J7AV93_COCIT|nr:hypothetical protein CIRG_01407 [Coccidioides immitis RMSCC 2394]